MIAFVWPQFEYLWPYLKKAGLQIGKFEIDNYPNQELRLTVKTDVTAKKCSIVGSVAPPAANFLNLTLLAHTLKKDGAVHVTAVLPYLSYSRQDKARVGEGLSIQWVGQLLAAAGIDQIVTVDIHSQTDAEVFPLPINALSPAKLLARDIKELHSTDVVVVAPDEGAIDRAAQVASAAHIKQLAHLQKVRTKGVAHLKLAGEVKRNVVIVDDILDTGATLISATKELRKHRVSNITIAVSHGLFTGQAWQELWRLGVSRIYCLDTIPQTANTHDHRIKIIACGSLLTAALNHQVFGAG